MYSFCIAGITQLCRSLCSRRGRRSVEFCYTYPCVRLELGLYKFYALAFQTDPQAGSFWLFCRSSCSQPVSSSFHTLLTLPSPSLLFLAVRRCIPFPPNSPTSHASDNTLIEISLPTSGVFYLLPLLFLLRRFFFLFFFSSYFLSNFFFCSSMSRLLHLSGSSSSSSYGSPVFHDEPIPHGMYRERQQQPTKWRQDKMRSRREGRRRRRV
jgi:hypothetical protein